MDGRTSLVARAPGKLFLLGEYAVLDGAPAVVAAVDRYVEVRLALSADRRVRITSPQLHARVEFAAAAPPDPDGPLRFLLAAWRSAVEQLPSLREQGVDLTVARGLDDGMDAKIGLGGSAAVTVAASAALHAVAGQDVDQRAVRDRLFRAALAAHVAAQQGIGSGADVAASCYGGVILFQRGEGGPVVRPVSLPNGTHLVVGWTGVPASTAGLVARYLAARPGGAAKRGAFVRESQSCVTRFLAAVARQELSAEAVNRNGDALAELGEALAIPLVTPELAALIRAARAHGVGAKLSGAGGGDCGIALTTDAACAERVRDAWRAAGIVPIDLRVANEGVSVARA